MEYERFRSISAAEYMQRMQAGWRRFGSTLFRPRCPACTECRSLRVPVTRFRPDRSQRRARKANDGQVHVQVGAPSVSLPKVRLYDRFHSFQAEAKDWPDHPAGDLESYLHSFVENPFPTLEWCYYLGDKLVGVGYVDDLPGGLSAIYFFYDPDQRKRGLGTWNVLNVIDYAASRRIPHVYLGYYVSACPSLSYKGRFRPNELLGPDGKWRPGLE
jgi:arginine-tRNA-protein transferase